MSDYDGSPVLHELLQRLLHLVFRFGVERGCSLIQDKDGRISDDRAGNCHPLFLPSGNSYATLTYHGVISMRHIHDEIMRKRGLGSLDYLFICCIRTAETYVFLYSIVEEHDVLGNSADMASPRMK